MFRVYTEDTGPEALATVLRTLARFGIDGATVYHGVGVWRGAVERSLVIETDGANPTRAPNTIDARAAVYSFAQDVKNALRQTAVGVVETADTFLTL